MHAYEEMTQGWGKTLPGGLDGQIPRVHIYLQEECHSNQLEWKILFLGHWVEYSKGFCLNNREVIYRSMLLWSCQKSLKVRPERIKLFSSNLTISRTKLRNIYRNTKNYPAPNKVKFTIYVIQ